MGVRIEILGPDDKISKNCYCRPLALTYEESDSVFTRSPYGSPINNMRWLRVTDLLCECWMGKTIREYNTGSTHCDYEFIRGEPPASHIIKKADV